MSDVATLNNVRSHTRRGTLALFFLTPVVISAVPRLTWLFLPLIAVALSVPVLRRRGRGVSYSSRMLHSLPFSWSPSTSSSMRLGRQTEACISRSCSSFGAGIVHLGHVHGHFVG